MDVVRTINSMAKFDQIAGLETIARSSDTLRDILTIVRPAVRRALEEDHLLVKIYIRQAGGAANPERDFIVKVTTITRTNPVSTAHMRAKVEVAELVVAGERLIWYEHNAKIDDAQHGLSPGGADLAAYAPK